MITSRLVGRLGNILFQIAHTYAISKLYNIEYYIPTKDVNLYTYKNTILNKVVFLDRSSYHINDSIYIDIPFTYTATPKPALDKTTIYGGFRQSEKFFEGYNNEIVELFSPTELFIKEIKESFPYLLEKNINTLCINVRRGDYALFPDRHPMYSKEYFYEAYNKYLLDKPDKVLIISDDLKWCKDHLYDIPNSIFIDKFNEEALWIMSLCKNFIISNSTFSWWGSFLSRNKNKQIICADQWFGPGVLEQGHSPEDIYGSKWTIIPCKCEPGIITPL